MLLCELDLLSWNVKRNRRRYSFGCYYSDFSRYKCFYLSKKKKRKKRNWERLVKSITTDNGLVMEKGQYILFYRLVRVPLTKTPLFLPSLLCFDFQYAVYTSYVV